MIPTWLNNARIRSTRRPVHRRDRRSLRLRAIELLEDRALLSTYKVNDLANTTSSSTDVTLRYAITQADAHPGSTIDFNVTGTIALSSALPDLNADVTITGPGASALTIEGGGPSSNCSILTVNSGVTASLSGLTLSDGNSDAIISDMGGGGGIFNNGTLTVTDSTISGNSAADDGGGIDNVGTLTVGNTIIAGNTAPNGPDIDGAVSTDERNNLIGENNGSTGFGSSDLTGTVADPLDADLGPLADNGGPTETFALSPGSPAINAGNNALIPSGQIYDQRGPGYARIVDGTVDIGAFEVQPAAPALTTQPSVKTVGAGSNATFTAAASGYPTPTVQWEVSANSGTSYTDITGATSTSLVLSDVTATMNGDLYEAVFTNSARSTTTDAVKLTFRPGVVLWRRWLGHH
jgi:hypothetical protein